MSLEEIWYEALKSTEIVVLPIKRLLTFGDTRIEYIFLSPSSVNVGDTTIRKGKIEIDRPRLVLPQNGASFEGFSSDSSPDMKDEQLARFFYLRGISFPPLKYKNEPYELDLYEGSVTQAEKNFLSEIRTHEKTSTGLVVGTENSWQFSVILMACHMIDAHLDNDLRVILERIKKK